MVGFSGNVKNAFSIIDDMRNLASDMELRSNDRKFDVLDFIKEWRNYTTSNVKHLYNDHDNTVHMFIAGNHTEVDSVGNSYAPSGVYQVKSPDYRPMSIHPFHWSHIGSGSDMAICKEIVEQLSNDFRFRLAAIDTSAEKLVKFLAPKLSIALEKGLTNKGVSSRLVIGVSIIGDTALATTYPAIAGSPSKLATTFEELMEIFNDISAKANFFASHEIKID
jgi:hypothetical protein